MCSVCSLTEAESKRSDARRQRINELWEMVGRLTPTLEDEYLDVVAEACMEGTCLLRAEGYVKSMERDVDDFMSEAVPMRQ